MEHRRQARSSHGFVLVTSLLILVVLAGLGAGAFFLTTMNLRIAENTRSSATAQYNAYEGLDIALIALAREYRLREDGTWPTLAELRSRIPTGSPYAVAALDYDAAGAGGVVPGGVVVVRGQGPRGASYETSARFRGQLSSVEVDAEGDPLFGTGWVTNASIAIKGNTTFTIPLWAGQAISAQATKVIASAGNFAHSGFVSSGAEADCTIFSQGTKYVRCERGQDPPSVPTFSFDAGLAELADEAEVTFPVCSGPNVHTITSSQTINAGTYANSTLCVAEGVTLTIIGTATGLYVLGPRSSTVRMEFDSTPASTDPDLDADDRRRVGVKIAAGTITQGSGSFVLGGENTLFSANLLNYQNTGAAMTNPGVISTLIGTEGSVVFGGNTAGTLNAVIWANGSVCKYGGGGLNFGGTILAGGTGDAPPAPCSRGIYWNGGGGGQFTTISNTNIPGLDDDSTNIFVAAGIRILAKRP
jgi:hypothetical protein